MSRYTGPKARNCRKLGVNIYGPEKYNKILSKRNYPAGMHGKTGFKKKSEYGKQLIEKQKAKLIFGLTERQFQHYYHLAIKSKGVTSDLLLKLLELRLDNIIYRAGIARTRMQARQIVTHGLIKLNNRRVNIPSISLKVGDVFEIRPRSKNSLLFEGIEKQKYTAPKWLKVDIKGLRGEIISEPAREDFEALIDSQTIIEFYSK